MTGFCPRCGKSLADHDACLAKSHPGAALDPTRFCGDCGSKLTVQVLPGGYESKCLPCERRERFAKARR